jgi:hypothetical protein
MRGDFDSRTEKRLDAQFMGGLHQYADVMSQHLAKRLVSVLGDNPHRVNYTRDVAKNRQKDINPEVLTDPYLQEYP